MTPITATQLSLLLGTSIIQDYRNSFLLTEDGKLFSFQSSRRITPVSVSNVKHFEFFSPSCYILIEQAGIEFKIKCFSSFGEDSCQCNEFDLSFPSDPVSKTANRATERVCVAMIEGPLDKSATKFFSDLLASDLTLIHDVLLVSIDNKLLWIKFAGSFRELTLDYSVETVTTMKANIRGIYCAGFIMVLDHDSLLTIFHLCPVTKAIRRKKIFLEGKVKCFRFHENLFAYSNLNKIIFIDASVPNAPSTHSVNLKNIVCFSIVPQQQFVIAICANNMFYHVPMEKPLGRSLKRSFFEEIESSEIEAIPEVAKFLENEEKHLLRLAKCIKEAQKLKIFMQHLLESPGFNAGSATVKFHRSFPQVSKETILCKFSDQRINSYVMVLEILIADALIGQCLTLNFRRHSRSGVATRTIKTDASTNKLEVVVPGEPSDHPSNEMSLELSLSYEIHGEPREFSFPISITRVIPFEGPEVKLKSSFDDCLTLIEKMKT